MSHALDRARERYDAALTIGDMIAIRGLIEGGTLRPRRAWHRGAQMFLVPYAGRRIKVIWLIEHRQIATVLPLKGRKGERRRTVLRDGRRFVADG